MKTDFTDLLNEINRLLLPWNYEYVAHTNTKLKGVDFIGCIMTRRRWGMRFICAVVRLPKNVLSHYDFLSYAADVRKVLSGQYAQFPFIKEICMYLVVQCNAEQFKELAATKAEFRDMTALHTTVWVGTFLVDSENFAMTEQKTWGPESWDRHYGAIKLAIETWCEKQQEIS